MGQFGTSFRTRKEANAEVKKQKAKGHEVQIRRLSKKVFPRRVKRLHVGSWLDWLNFA